jgi:hypothetical protein
MGLTTSVALGALLLVLMLSYGIFAWADHGLAEYVSKQLSRTLLLLFF